MPGVSVFGFPDQVNEKAARVVAGGVAIGALVTLITGWHWLLVLLALGFLAGRVRTKAEPAGAAGDPRRGASARRSVNGARSAEAVRAGDRTGADGVAAVAGLWLGQPAVASALVGILLVFATLESVAGFCAGCWMFGHLMRLGVIPEQTCAACADMWRRA